VTEATAFSALTLTFHRTVTFLIITQQPLKTNWGFRSALMSMKMSHTADSFLSHVPNSIILTFVQPCIVTSLSPHSPYYVGYITNSTAHPLSSTKKFKNYAIKQAWVQQQRFKQQGRWKSPMAGTRRLAQPKTTNYSPTPPPNLH
jgi:hypothetical protein